MQQASGADATLSCTSASGGAYAWGFTTGARHSGPRRASPKEALEAWLGRHRTTLAAASATELDAWSPQSAETQLDADTREDLVEAAADENLEGAPAESEGAPLPRHRRQHLQPSLLPLQQLPGRRLPRDRLQRTRSETTTRPAGSCSTKWTF